MIEALRDAVWPDERHFHGPFRERRHPQILLERHIARELQALPDRPAMDHRGAGAGEIGNFPAAERRAARAAVLLRADALAAAVVAAHRKPEAVLEIEPADLAVGDDVQARAFLQIEIFLDAIELQPGEGLAVDQPAVE